MVAYAMPQQPKTHDRSHNSLIVAEYWAEIVLYYNFTYFCTFHHHHYPKGYVQFSLIKAVINIYPLVLVRKNIDTRVI